MTTTRGTNRRGIHRSGSLLLVVLVVVALLTITGMGYLDWAFTQRRAADTLTRGVQARLLAESGVEHALVAVAEPPEEIEQAGGLVDNPAKFRGVLVLDSPAGDLRGRFALIAPAQSQGVWSGVRFGLENESGRLNLNTVLLADKGLEGASRTLLMALPGMTEPIADAILDFIDTDDESRDFGAENTYYAALDPPIAPPNGPLESLEQLLLVRDVTPELLYGLDRNRDFTIDSAEAMLPLGVDNTDGRMDRGWLAYLTLASAESNLRPDGTAKIDINMKDLQELHAQLKDALGLDEANFICALRQGGPDQSQPTEEGAAQAPQEVGDGATPGGTTQTKQPGEIVIDFATPGAETIGSVLDLIGVKAEVVEQGSTQMVLVETPFAKEPARMGQYIVKLMENLTASNQKVVPGRLNINQCPRELLQGLPGLEPGVADQIVAERDFEVVPERPERRYETWLVTEGLVTLDTLKSISPLVTGGGDVYRAQSVGFFDSGGTQARLEVVIDATAIVPKIVQTRNLTALGGSIPVANLGAAPDETTSTKPLQ